MSDFHAEIAQQFDGVADVWEPYTLEVGQKVMVHLSHECRSQFYRNGDLSRTVDHTWSLDGTFGVITEIRRSEFGRWGLPSDGHFYRVRVAGWSGWFAAAELVPLDERQWEDG
jgi:hypothetical protein